MVMRTAQIFDLRPALQEKKQAMTRVERHANPEWLRVMYELLEKVAERQPQLTPDHVFDLYDATLQTVWTHELRAFGAVMARGARNGIIRKANLPTVPSHRPWLHASPLQIWDSLIFW
jgi:hypothetical protein